jgi:hypothetical protein
MGTDLVGEGKGTDGGTMVDINEVTMVKLKKGYTTKDRKGCVAEKIA